jgi:hypothetical protein
VWEELRRRPEDVRAYPPPARAVDGGASPADVAAAMSAAAYETAFRLLFLLSAEHAEEGDYKATEGWALVEANLLADGAVVPRVTQKLDFLHEDLLTSDPTGNEGADFLT